MKPWKARITISVDPALVRIGQEAVASGRAPSFSAWVSDAMAEHAARERRRAALRDAVAEYERRFGTITREELAAQAAADAREALHVPLRRRTKRKNRAA